MEDVTECSRCGGLSRGPSTAAATLAAASEAKRRKKVDAAQYDLFHAIGNGDVATASELWPAARLTPSEWEDALAVAEASGNEAMVAWVNGPKRSGRWKHAPRAHRGTDFPTPASEDTTFLEALRYEDFATAESVEFRVSEVAREAALAEAGTTGNVRVTKWLVLGGYATADATAVAAAANAGHADLAAWLRVYAAICPGPACSFPKCAAALERGLAPDATRAEIMGACTCVKSKYPSAFGAGAPSCSGKSADIRSFLS